MLELGSKSKKYSQKFQNLLTIQILTKYLLKEKKS